jgi:hypothetical protein
MKSAKSSMILISIKVDPQVMRREDAKAMSWFSLFQVTVFCDDCNKHTRSVKICKGLMYGII